MPLADLPVFTVDSVTDLGRSQLHLPRWLRRSLNQSGKMMSMAWELRSHLLPQSTGPFCWMTSRSRGRCPPSTPRSECTLGNERDSERPEAL